MPKRILVTGASVAGLTTAFWLLRHGFEVVVLERTPVFRTGGQNIDIRDIGRDVIRWMGLEEEALRRGTGEEGTVWVDGSGRPVAEFRQADGGGDGPTAEMEILRGDLASLLLDALRDRAAIRFGDHVAGIRPDNEGATVSFARGGSERFDAVVVAEGVGSATRDLVFPGENAIRWMDMTIAYFTIPRVPSDNRMWRWFNAPGKRSVSLRPDNHGTTRAMLSLHGPTRGEESWSPDRQKTFLRERFAGAGWETPRVLDGLDRTDDFYLDALRQVRMKRWSRGPVALVGDAAWCATPLAGIGTTLAVAGAYVLAGELARASDIRSGFESFERFMRPLVEKKQGVPKIAPRLMHPKSRAGIGLLHGVLAAAASRPVRTVSARIFGGGDAKMVELPRY